MKFCQTFISVLLALTLVTAVSPFEASARTKVKKPQTARAKKAPAREQTLVELMAAAGIARGNVSMMVMSLSDGKSLYEHNPDLAVNPASNVKLVTAAAALHELGPDFTFKTEFYADSGVRGGRLKNVWIKGYGDPMLVTEELEAIATRMRAGGLRGIDGDIHVDDSYFDRNPLLSYDADSSEQVFSIVTGPLSCNFNSVVVKACPGIKPGDRPVITTEPSLHRSTLKNRAVTTGRGRASIKAGMEESSGTITVQGNMPRSLPEYSVRRGVNDPGLFTGSAIIGTLASKGIEVRGVVKRGAVPAGAVPVYTHESPPLKEILKGMGKFSNNFIAEQILKTLGAVEFHPPGTTQKGVAVLENYLRSLGIPASSFLLDNGSGLSRRTRMTARQINKILLDIYRTRWKDDWMSALSIAGVDGTLKRRMRGSPLMGHIFAKTGTLNHVHALSGYVIHDGSLTPGRNLVFSFLFNNVPASPDKLAKFEEKLLQTLSMSHSLNNEQARTVTD